MLKKLLLIVGVLIALLALAIVAIIVFRPDDYRIERSVRIERSTPEVYAVVGDFARFAAWSPWQKLDPGMRIEVSTPSSGVGATYAWFSDAGAGQGRMTITAVEPPTSVTQRLEFIEPFPSVAETGFTLVADGEATIVTWTMSGSHSPMAKVFGVFVDVEAMLGRDFEEGLDNLKRLVETP